MHTPHVASGLTNRARARSLTLVAAFVSLTPMVACGRAQPVTVASTGQSIRYPRDAARFDAEPLSDSTLAFGADDAPWVKAGMLGIAVDPARGDALVAKLQITNVVDGRVEALVTGQTTRVADGHVVLLVQPRTQWWRHRLYWFGMLSGAAVVGALTLF